jgi:DNA-binding NarL/FixJ family response regulator
VRRTILVVDDHEAFRRTVASLLEADGFEVVGEVGDGTSALAECARLRPAVVLLDVYLPDIDGFEVTARLARAEHRPVVILTSSRDESALRGRLASSPARGFVPKRALSGDALAALVDDG